MWMRLTLTALAFSSAAGAGSVSGLPVEVLVDFTEPELPAFVQFNNSKGLDRTDDGLEVQFDRVDWPNVFFRASAAEPWDWSGYAGVGVNLYNPTDSTVTVALRLDNDGADGMHFCNNLRNSVLPRQRLEFRMWFNRGDNQALWGMRGVPGGVQYGEGKPLDLEVITAFQLFLPLPNREHTLRLESLYLFGDADSTPPAALLPFVDAFGQYKHAEWPGKLQEDAAFKERIREEHRAWEQHPEVPERDRFGGWAAGPRREATGWFRTEEIDGKWWLITPEGTLFLSLGITCVGTWERTFVEQREDWFDWLPERDAPLFGDLYTDVTGAHSMADPVGGSGATFSFYSANLIRKYGADWKTRWRESVYPRLQHWGFTTIANWSQQDVLQESPIPFVASASNHSVKLLEGAEGYWSKMMDVYDPSFETSAENAAAHLGLQYADNPLCIGYFVDNELAWEGVVDGVLAGSAEQPAYRALTAFLRKRYPSLEALNDAWQARFNDWESLRRPDSAGEAFHKDMEDFLYAFAHRYFSVIKDALARHAPNQLYLGCRFAVAPAPVVKACADVVDVVSFNLYYPVIPRDLYTGDQAMDKPLIIGEFHFGALDRGMFHTGLVGVESQKERAEHYHDYVKSVVEHPAFVGCHWFQYIDEPITGRWFDGENYNIGFLDVTDTPYPELVEAARNIHAKAYRLRHAARSEDARRDVARDP